MGGDRGIQALPDVQQEADYADQQDVIDDVLVLLFPEQEEGDQQEVVQIEYGDKGDGYDGVAQIGTPIDAVSRTIDKEERETKHDPPADNMYQYFQRAAG